MKTTKLNSKFWKQKAGAVGIGTLIVFIAMILVAAVAAVVLIRTSGVLEQKAYEVGMSSTAEAANKIKITSVVGHTTSQAVDYIMVTILPSAGAEPIDLETCVMTFQTGDVYINGISYNGTSDVANDNLKMFNRTVLQGDNDAVLEKTENDIYQINYYIGDGSARSTIAENTEFTITLTPMAGAPAALTITTPASMDNTYEELYP